ncbi:MAG: PilZ domain-containing protein [Magnetococcales bacterium]|nr:PilZ domain-containing protein [Magnetococcales bacterium]
MHASFFSRLVELFNADSGLNGRGVSWATRLFSQGPRKWARFNLNADAKVLLDGSKSLITVRVKDLSDDGALICSATQQGFLKTGQEGYVFLPLGSEEDAAAKFSRHFQVVREKGFCCGLKFLDTDHPEKRPLHLISFPKVYIRRNNWEFEDNWELLNWKIPRDNLILNGLIDRDIIHNIHEFMEHYNEPPAICRQTLEREGNNVAFRLVRFRQLLEFHQQALDHFKEGDLVRLRERIKDEVTQKECYQRKYRELRESFQYVDYKYRVLQEKLTLFEKGAALSAQAAKKNDDTTTLMQSIAKAEVISRHAVSLDADDEPLLSFGSSAAFDPPPERKAAPAPALAVSAGQGKGSGPSPGSATSRQGKGPEPSGAGPSSPGSTAAAERARPVLQEPAPVARRPGRWLLPVAVTGGLVMATGLVLFLSHHRDHPGFGPPSTPQPASNPTRTEMVPPATVAKPNPPPPTTVPAVTAEVPPVPPAAPAVIHPPAQQPPPVAPAPVASGTTSPVAGEGPRPPESIPTRQPPRQPPSQPMPSRRPEEPPGMNAGPMTQLDPAVQSRLDGLLAKAGQLLDQGRLTRPEGDNALAVIRQAQAQAPGHHGVGQALERLVTSLLGFVRQDIAAQRLSKPVGSSALDRVKVAAELLPGHPAIPAAQGDIIQAYQRLYQEERAHDPKTALAYLKKAASVFPEHALTAAVQEELKNVGPDGSRR